MKNFSIFFCSFLAFVNVFSQTPIELANIDNVKISYTLTKLEATDKKDKYLIQVTLVNTSSNSVYYAIPGIVNADKTVTMDPFNDKFAKVKIRNSTGLFGDGIGLSGDNTGLITTGNGFVYVLYPGKMYNSETTFKVKSGEVPIVTNTVKQNLNQLSNYDLQINRSMIDGLWKSTCTSVDMSLSFVDMTGTSPANIIQSVNGKQIKWIKQTDITFIKENDNSTTLSYQKATNSFLFSSSDGISCTLTKKN